MSNRSAVSDDAKYLQLDNKLRDLKQQQQKTRPANYFYLAIILGVLGFILPVLFGVIAWLFALASLLMVITTSVKASELNKQIANVEAQMDFLTSAVRPPSFPAPESVNVTKSILGLKELLDKN